MRTEVRTSGPEQGIRALPAACKQVWGLQRERDLNLLPSLSPSQSHLANLQSSKLFFTSELLLIALYLIGREAIVMAAVIFVDNCNLFEDLHERELRRASRSVCVVFDVLLPQEPDGGD